MKYSGSINIQITYIIANHFIAVSEEDQQSFS